MIPAFFEAIRAAVQAYGAGKISVGDGVGEIIPVPKTNDTLKRYAPSFSVPDDPSSCAAHEHPYTMQTLAKFLGFVDPNGESTRTFDAAFGAIELLKEGSVGHRLLLSHHVR